MLLIHQQAPILYDYMVCEVCLGNPTLQVQKKMWAKALSDCFLIGRSGQKKAMPECLFREGDE
jgi:hypothetical protein